MCPVALLLVNILVISCDPPAFVSRRNLSTTIATNDYGHGLPGTPQHMKATVVYPFLSFIRRRSFRAFGRVGC